MPAEQIRQSRRDDIPALGALFREVFGADRDPAVWSWKYFDNPRGLTSFVCEADGRLVAHCGGAPVRFRDYGLEHLALQSTDFMSSPRYPGGIGRGGVFVRTAQRFFAAYCGPSKVPMVYGFPGERHRLLGERLLGYRPIETVGEMRIDPESDRIGIEELRERDLPFFSRVPVDFGALRDPVYLRWRYLDRPGARYGIVKVGRPLGMGTQIAAIVHQDERTIHVMEVAGVFSREAVGRLTGRLAGLGKEVVFWGSPGHPVGQRLVEGGFRMGARDHRVEFRSFTQRPTPRSGELYYTLGDYDVY